ncbi:TPA: hypothetical protein HA265_05735 [Candidatus Woesearchaeota archaeon]|nr:hypothetical protein [Candidatus Woesearchaeota archaeon]
MDSTRRAEYLRRRLAIRDGVRDVKKYLLIGTALLGFAYFSDSCDARDKIAYTASKAKQGIEYVIDKARE